MEVLREVYRRLHKNPNDRLHGLRMYHSGLYYVRSHLNAKFNKNYSMEDIVDLLESENMLPDRWVVGVKREPVKSSLPAQK